MNTTITAGSDTAPPVPMTETQAYASLRVRFGMSVRRLRTARGWSQEELAARSDLNRTYVGEIERGDAMPSLATAYKLAHALHTTLSELVSSCDGFCRL